MLGLNFNYVFRANLLPRVPTERERVGERTLERVSGLAYFSSAVAVLGRKQTQSIMGY